DPGLFNGLANSRAYSCLSKMFYFVGITLKEAAEVLGISAGNRQGSFRRGSGMVVSRDLQEPGIDTSSGLSARIAPAVELVTRIARVSSCFADSVILCVGCTPAPAPQESREGVRRS